MMMMMSGLIIGVSLLIFGMLGMARALLHPARSRVRANAS
ncbi:hypothetical protein PMI05_05591 [Brevibacillus sp. BC25]|nr:hypothetical protein PMI05_05591 [Brevibacillus sp. BC25]